MAIRPHNIEPSVYVGHGKAMEGRVREGERGQVVRMGDLQGGPKSVVSAAALQASSAKGGGEEMGEKQTKERNRKPAKARTTGREREDGNGS